MLCAIWYHLYNLKNLKKTHGGKLLLVKFQAEACNFLKNNRPPWVFFTFSKSHKMIPNCPNDLILTYAVEHLLEIWCWVYPRCNCITEKNEIL